MSICNELLSHFPQLLLCLTVCFFFSAEPFVLCRRQFERLKLQSIVDPNAQPIPPLATPPKKQAVTNGDEKEKPDRHTHKRRKFGGKCEIQRGNEVEKINSRIFRFPIKLREMYYIKLEYINIWYLSHIIVPQ